MFKFYWGISTLLLTVIIAGGYMFGVADNSAVAKETDTRKAIVLSAPERDYMLAGMRDWQKAIQDITIGYGEENMTDVYESAHKVGMKAAKALPPKLVAKLPGDFKFMGTGTYKAFDDIADEAEGMGDAQVVSAKLGELKSNCVTCHKIYRFKVKGQ